MNQFQHSQSSQNNIMNITKKIDHKFNSIENKIFNPNQQNHNDENIIKLLYNHLHRPLSQHLRPRELYTNEWFYTKSNDILFD
ncbi:unnamed protein product [Rotaria sp. Silwood1]|nr:unnamed protein product [Rotaria sp. Silwood1]CAF3469519.1 unnamed protein product [Rotaria sp. Silwood1]CAF4535523.1 unnamed protein product [Rotaria sp. Silwood1]CAF4773553.1 unnamed protein product [Rotaria sp. Silwood1]